MYKYSLFLAALVGIILGACKENPEQEALPTISLSAPTDDETVDLSTGNNLTFTWIVEGEISGEYTLLLSQSADLASPKTYSTESTSFEITAAELNVVMSGFGVAEGATEKIYWSVKPYYSYIKANLPPTRALNITRIPIPTILLTAPANDASFDLKTEESVSFAWTDIADISCYTLALSLSPDLSSAQTINLTGNPYVLTKEELDMKLEDFGIAEGAPAKIYWSIYPCDLTVKFAKQVRSATITRMKPTYPEGTLISYDFASNAPAASTYTVDLNGNSYYVYPVPKRASGDGNSGLNAELVSFGINGDIAVKIKSTVAIKSVKIRPLSAGIIPVVGANTIKFTLTKPQNLSIEINDNITRPLFVFANAPETNVPDKNDPNVIFFEKGQIHDKGLFSIPSNKTVYIAPGAIVQGAMITDQTNQIQVAGRGILSGEKLYHGQTRMIEINRAKNVIVEGITVVASAHWTIPLTACENVEVRDVKIVNDADWDDGIDVVGSKNVVIDNCFIRTKDDCVAIKSGVNYFTNFDAQIRVENIRVKNSTMWNGTYGNCLEIGFETRTDTIKDVIFENIDLIHNQNPGHTNESAITIHNGDRAVVDNILYKNIRIEDPEWTLIDLRILQSEYSKDPERGKISNIRFEDISVTSSKAVSSYMFGFDATHDIKNIHIKNLKINETKVLSSSALNLSTNNFLSNIVFE
jgi:hypothetical protein